MKIFFKWQPKIFLCCTLILWFCSTVKFLSSPLDHHFHYQQFILGREYKLIRPRVCIIMWRKQPSSGDMYGLWRWIDLVQLSALLLTSPIWPSASYWTFLTLSCIFCKTRIINPLTHRHFGGLNKIMYKKYLMHSQTHK